MGVGTAVVLIMGAGIASFALPAASAGAPGEVVAEPAPGVSRAASTPARPVTEFAWNGLRAGDRVVVNEHRVEAVGHPALGTVVYVNQHPRHNSVGVHLDGDPRQLVRWPTRFEVSEATSTHG
jgi:hypothetical protein